ncbi:uncharacterized protein CC84DRAFT_324897 [Paraphaeosphaeria sporulosa]|uniref:Uncharacterized protein n=1 Tax=Paraphaeosphaeria sporulosa TaxID=1460663 RepID=A0A177C267_9PLEO|nr:uncharacterized protein CC84DRAFT_324897 [Paraphaeosphaeria sporulosa]OAG00730.1 hypothetical protein CC84DRAFT_324897 [Paraphaeosphaeria sporulosa]
MQRCRGAVPGAVPDDRVSISRARAGCYGQLVPAAQADRTWQRGVAISGAWTWLETWSPLACDVSPRQTVSRVCAEGRQNLLGSIRSEAGWAYEWLRQAVARERRLATDTGDWCAGAGGTNWACAVAAHGCDCPCRVARACHLLVERAGFVSDGLRCGDRGGSCATAYEHPASFCRAWQLHKHGGEGVARWSARFLARLAPAGRGFAVFGSSGRVCSASPRVRRRRRLELATRRVAPVRWPSAP